MKGTNVAKAFGILLLIVGIEVGCYAYSVMSDPLYDMSKAFEGTEMPTILLYSAIAAYIGGIVLIAYAYFTEGGNLNVIKVLSVFVLAVSVVACIIGAAGFGSAEYKLLRASEIFDPLPITALCFGIVSLAGGFALAVNSFQEQ